MTEHKPCPFCGGAGQAVEDEGFAEHADSTIRWIAIECVECGCKGPEARAQTCRAIQYPGRPPIEPGSTGPAEWRANAEARAWAAWDKRHDA
jgi:hypothetical protein